MCARKKKASFEAKYTFTQTYTEAGIHLASVSKSDILQHVILDSIFFPIKDTFGTLEKLELGPRIREQ